jgi:hypothetical protein
VPRMMTVTSYAVYFAANSLGYQDWRATSGILSQEPGTECVIHFVDDTGGLCGLRVRATDLSGEAGTDHFP